MRGTACVLAGELLEVPGADDVLGPPSEPMSARNETASSVVAAAARAAATSGSRSACGAIQTPPPSEPIPAGRAACARDGGRAAALPGSAGRRRATGRPTRAPGRTRRSARARPRASGPSPGVTDHPRAPAEPLAARASRRACCARPPAVRSARCGRGSTSAATSDSCQTRRRRGIAYSPSTVSSTERAGGRRRRSAAQRARSRRSRRRRRPPVTRPRARARRRCPRPRSP